MNVRSDRGVVPYNTFCNWKLIRLEQPTWNLDQLANVTENGSSLNCQELEPRYRKKNYIGLYANWHLLLTDLNPTWFVYGECAQWQIFTKVSGTGTELGRVTPSVSMLSVLSSWPIYTKEWPQWHMYQWSWSLLEIELSYVRMTTFFFM